MRQAKDYSDDELLKLDAQYKNKQQPEKSTFANIAGGAFSGLSSAKSGLLDLLSGAGKRMAPLLGASPGQIPQYHPPPEEVQAMKEFPVSASVGRFAGQALPMLAVPELKALGAAAEGLGGMLGLGAKAAPMLGRGASVAGQGALIGSAMDSDKPLSEAAGEGALGSLAGASAAKAAYGVGKLGLNALKMGGVATKKGVEKVMQAADNLGLELPLAEVIQSPQIAKLQKVGLKNIPGSGMTKEYENLSKGIKENVSNLINKLNPKNLHAGEEVQNFLSEKYNNLKKQVKSVYDNLGATVEKVAPGMIHENNKLHDVSKEIKKEFAVKLQRPGGSIKVPGDVKSYINEVKKQNSTVRDSFLDDEIINNHIGSAFAELKSGGKASKEAERALPFWFRLKDANLKDVDSTIQGVKSPEISQKWKEAKNFYKENIAPFHEDKSKLKTMILEQDPDKIPGMFLQTSNKQLKSEALRKVTDQIPQDIKNVVAHHHLVGPHGKEGIDILKAYKGLQPKQQELLFDKPDKQILDDMMTIKNHVGDEFNQMFVPKTGAQTSMILGAMGIAEPAYDILHGRDPSASLGRSAAILGGARGLKSAVMSNTAKKAYLKGLSGVGKKVKKTGREALLGLPMMGQNKSQEGQ